MEREDHTTTRHVIAVVADIFFASKIRATAEHLRVAVTFTRSLDDLLEAARHHSPSLIIVDLHSQHADPFALASQLKSDAQLAAIPLIGFFSHVQTALMRQAGQAGYDRILPRSAFTKHLPEILEGEG
jgi:CheY-like chemotaxis protein